MPWGDGHMFGVEPETCSSAVVFQPLFYFDSWETFKEMHELMEAYYRAHRTEHETAIPKAIEDMFPDG